MRFLCAEDNDLNAEILRSILEMYGVSCDIYPDGAALVQAFDKVQPGEYDAILMDVFRGCAAKPGRGYGRAYFQAH